MPQAHMNAKTMHSADMDVWKVSGPEIMDTDKYLSGTNAPELEEDVRLCITSGARQMVLNCAPLTYMTGAGLRVFLNIARMMREAGGTISVKNLSGQPREMFDACGMDAVIPLVDKAPVFTALQAA